MPVRHATQTDLPALTAIYNDAVRNLAAIWTEAEDSLAERGAWLDARLGQGFPVLVATDAAGTVVGYATYGGYRGKPGYRLTVEHSIYMAPEARGTGMGTPLMAALIEQAKTEGYHVMVGVIEARNTGSLRFHERFGFSRAGQLDQVGFKHGEWLSEILMTLRLNDDAAPARI